MTFPDLTQHRSSSSDSPSNRQGKSSGPFSHADAGTIADLLGDGSEALQVGDLLLTVEYLKTESSFLDAITIQLYQKLIELYGEELDQEITSDTILTNIKNLAEEWLEQQQRWPRLLQEIRTNLVTRSLQDMERDLGDTVLQSLDWEAFNRMLLQYLGSGDRDRLNARLIQLETFHAQRVADQIIQSLNLEQQPFAALKRLLRLGTDAPRIVTIPEGETRPSGPITEIPSEFPVVSQEDAEGNLYFSDRLQTDLWETDLRNVAFLRYQSRHNRNAFLEHYLVNPMDLRLLPWEMTEQLLQKFGLGAARLHLLLTAWAMQQPQPWQNTFQITLEEIVPLLDGTRPTRANRAVRQNQVAGLAYALSCLLVKVIWGDNPATMAETPVAKLWDILIEPHGSLDWSSGRIEQPDSVSLLIRPGLWIEGLVRHSAGRITTVLTYFGQTAVILLERQALTNDLAMRLLVYLMLDTRLQASAPTPHEYEVRQLLAVGLSGTHPLEEMSLSQAQDLFEFWQQTLEILVQLGWQARAGSPAGAIALHPSQFYLSPYPKWLDPTQDIRKPKGWVGNWLDQRLSLYPPVEAIAPANEGLEYC